MRRGSFVKESTLIFNTTKLPPELNSKDELFKYLGIGKDEQALLKKWPTKGYKLKIIKKRSGAKRNLYIPNDRLKYLQRLLLSLTERMYSPRYPVHGFTKNKGIITNAAAHQRRRYILNIDIKDFFPSISRNRIFGLLRNIGIDEEVAEIICDLTLIANQLPQGAPTSPILSNMICLKLDKMLLDFCKENHFRYTRYADDITISSHTYPAELFSHPRTNFGNVLEEELSNTIRSIFSQNGFLIHPSKTWYMTSKTRKDVTGLVVNEFVNVRRKFVRNIRSSLFKVDNLGYELAQKEFRERYPNNGALKENLRGRIDFVGQVKGKSNPIFRKFALKYNQLFSGDPITIPPTYEDILKNSCWVLECSADNKNGEDMSTQGTGVFIKDLGLVTANHVIEGIDDLSKLVLFTPIRFSEKWAITSVIYSCQHHDIAILAHDVPSVKYHELEKARANASKHENVVAVGYPDYDPGDTLNERKMDIVSFPVRKGINFLEMGGLVSQGMSGGPVINQKHEVYAIISKGGIREGRQVSTLIDQIEL